MQSAINIGRKKRLLFLWLALFACRIADAQDSSTWPTTGFGNFKVGFKNFHEKTTTGEDILINMWYPAGAGGERMTLKDYIVSSSLKKNAPDSIALKEFKRVLE